MSSLLTRLKITLGSTRVDEEGQIALRSGASVTVKVGRNIEFMPVAPSPRTGIILYPGGRCDAAGYAPLMQTLAKAGYLAIIPNMPLKMAVLDASRAGKIMAAHPDIRQWVIGGHSMGGVMAVAWAFKNPDKLAGLFLLGSYAASMHAMPDSKLPATSIAGSLDSFTRQSEVDAAPTRLPAGTRFVTIEGGDHYQFGCFRNAPRTATISRDEQQLQMTKALLEFLEASVPG